MTDDITGTPEFREAIEAYCDFSDAGLQDSPAALRAWRRVMDHAPESFKRMMIDKARALGLLPDRPDGYLPDGQPVYRLETIAQRLGIPIEEATASAELYLGITGADAIDPSTIARVQ